MLGIGPNTPRLLGPGVEKQTAADDHRRGRRGSDVRGVSGTGHQDDRVPEEGRGLLHAQVIRFLARLPKRVV